MKKNYVRPTMIGEKFAADEFVAACGDVITYNFICDAGNGRWGDVYTKDGTNLTPGSKYYYACGETHAANVKDDFIEGTYVLNGGNDETGGYVGIWPFGHYEKYESIPVIIWRGQDGKNVHCTTDLDQKNWGRNKS